MMRIFFAICLSCLFVPVLHPQNNNENQYLNYVSFDVIESVILSLKEKEVEELNKKGRITSFSEGFSTKYAPSSDISEEIKAHAGDINPNICVETLIVHPIDPSLSERENFPLAVYNILRSISTMEGIEYYSASRERMRIFYHESYAVSRKSEKARIPDPIVSEIPKKDSILIFQHDSSFGKNYHKVTYKDLGDAFTLSMMNMTTMFYSILPIVRPGNLKISLGLHLSEESIIFYGNCSVEVLSLFGLENRVRDSFRNRLIALYDWFKDQLHNYSPIL